MEMSSKFLRHVEDMYLQLWGNAPHCGKKRQILSNVSFFQNLNSQCLIYIRNSVMFLMIELKVEG